MARRSKAKYEVTPIEAVVHRGDSRVNIPTAELKAFALREETAPYLLRYPRDPSLDPQLVWKGKDEQDGKDLEVPSVPIYIQEHIAPRAIIEDLRKEQQEGQPRQASLFADFNGMALEKRVEFYQHSQKWTNRMILGDSLLVMASLAEKEGLKGQVQMIYLDPPYGIKFGSNWQVSTRKRDVRDGRAESATREPEQIKAFRDTWKLGIHSYLAYWRDRLAVARDLLTETGSIFVQIGDENVHLVRNVLDEVFGSENFVTLISFAKTTGFSGNYLSSICDYILWYGKTLPVLKYRELFRQKEAGEEGATKYRPVSSYRGLQDSELDPTHLATLADLTSQGASANSPQAFNFRGKNWTPPQGLHWKTTVEGLERLAAVGRIVVEGDSLRYVRLMEDFSVFPQSNVWLDIGGVQSRTDPKVYVVQTATEAVKRCLLMTTDPGDLVLDPTCVRKGTGVWVASAPTPALPVDGEGAVPVPPSTGGLQGGPQAELVPVERIKPGQYVITHDGQPHRVRRLIRKQYRGQLVGLRHAHCSERLWLTADHRVLAKLRPRTLGGQRDWNGSPPEHLERRRQLRREATPTERQLWAALRQDHLGFKFRRQHPIGPYIADFYCREAHLAVEIDGATHYTKDALLYDAERDAHMRSLELDVLRFTTTEVAQNLPGVCLAIQNQCRLRTQSTEYTQWVQAGALQPGDLVFFGVERRAVPIEVIETLYTEEEVYDLEVEDAHSFLTEVCAVHNCGSGTTAYVAEQWGRRWITIDTSRVAIALARTRLMSARFPYYILVDTPEGIKKEQEITGIVGAYGHPPLQHDIKKGFVYKRVPHVTLKSIANNPDIKEGMSREEIDAAIARHSDSETLYDQPYEDNKIVRVTGPFTVESLSPHRVIADDVDRTESEAAAANGAGPGQFEAMILDNLRKAGVQNTVKDERLKFESLEPFAGVYIHGDGTYVENGPSTGSGQAQTKRVAVCIGPEHGTVGKELVQEAAKEAVRGVGFDLLVICGFAFDPYVSEEVKRYGKLRVLQTKINPDLLMGDEFLKKTGAGNLFMVFGEPDIDIKKQPDGKLVAQINGVDVYDPTTGQVRSNSTDDIACWFIDSDYNEECFFVRHAYFCGGDEPYERLQRALKADVDEAAWASLYSTISRPFDPPKTGRIAVKVINHYGDEVLKVYQV